MHRAAWKLLESVQDRVYYNYDLKFVEKHCSILRFRPLTANDAGTRTQGVRDLREASILTGATVLNPLLGGSSLGQPISVDNANNDLESEIIKSDPEADEPLNEPSFVEEISDVVRKQAMVQRSRFDQYTLIKRTNASSAELMRHFRRAFLEVVRTNYWRQINSGRLPRYRQP